MISFSNLDVGINGIGVACEGVTISTDTPISPNFSLGNKRSIARTPNGGIKSTFQFNYIIDLANDPTLSLISSLRQLHESFTYPNYQLAVGGVSGVGYLSSLSLGLTTAEKIKSTAEYTVFTPLSGYLQDTNHQFTYEITDSTRVPHSNYVTFGYSNLYVPVWDFSYTFKANYAPIYALGSKEPIQVQTFDAQEAVSLMVDSYTGLLMTGNFSQNAAITEFKLSSSDSLYSLNFPFDSTTEIKSSSVTLNPNDIARTVYQLNTFF